MARVAAGSSYDTRTWTERTISAGSRPSSAQCASSTLARPATNSTLLCGGPGTFRTSACSATSRSSRVPQPPISMMVALLDGLERRGLVARRRSSQDRRRTIVGLTETGRERMARAEEARLVAERRFLAPLDAETAATLVRALRALPPVR